VIIAVDVLEDQKRQDAITKNITDLLAQRDSAVQNLTLTTAAAQTTEEQAQQIEEKLNEKQSLAEQKIKQAQAEAEKLAESQREQAADLVAKIKEVYARRDHLQQLYREDQEKTELVRQHRMKLQDMQEKSQAVRKQLRADIRRTKEQALATRLALKKARAASRRAQHMAYQAELRLFVKKNMTPLQRTKLRRRKFAARKLHDLAYKDGKHMV